MLKISPKIFVKKKKNKNNSFNLLFKYLIVSNILILNIFLSLTTKTFFRTQK